jgi:hypothetical protein
MAEIHSSKEIDLALEAAILPQPNSILAWEKLLNLVEFEDLNNSILRIAPSIYKNLASNTNVSSYEKLKGSYRYNWAKNSKMFTGIYPVLKNLNQKNINYRLLKGAAINLLHNSIGIRVMGDFDLLIHVSDLVVVQEILYRNNFSLKYFPKVSKHLSLNPIVKRNNLTQYFVSISILRKKQHVYVPTNGSLACGKVQIFPNHCVNLY